MNEFCVKCKENHSLCSSTYNIILFNMLIDVVCPNTNSMSEEAECNVKEFCSIYFCTAMTHSSISTTHISATYVYN